VHELIEKNEHLSMEFNIGKWERYDYDVDRGTIIFSHEGRPRVSGDIQVVGTTATNPGNWLWAWANDWWPETVCEYAHAAKAFGEMNKISQLTTAYLSSDSLVELGWELSAVTARIVGAMGAYRVPSENGYLFLLYRKLWHMA